VDCGVRFEHAAGAVFTEPDGVSEGSSRTPAPPGKRSIARGSFRELRPPPAAYESSWSIALAPDDDRIAACIPYPRKAANARGVEHARTSASELYREIAD
jgi:hypothetical protein